MKKLDQRIGALNQELVFTLKLLSVCGQFWTFYFDRKHVELGVFDRPSGSGGGGFLGEPWGELFHTPSLTAPGNLWR